MPLTPQEYHEFMTAVTQIRDVYQAMETEMKKIGQETGESKEKQARLEVVIQRLEAELQKPAPVPTVTANGEHYKEAPRMKAFLKAMRKGYHHLDGEERKLVQTANAVDAPAIPGAELKTVVTSGLMVSEDTAGGLLAPPEYVSEIIKGYVSFSPMRQYCRVRNTSNRSIQMPKRTGLVSASWVGERTVRTETPGWSVGRLEIPTQEMYSLVLISEQDLEDMEFDVEAEIRNEISEQFGVAEGKALISGNATLQPQGILTNSEITISKSGTDDTITADSLMDCMYDLPEYYSSRAQWYMQRKTVAAIRKLKYGTSSAEMYIWQPGLSGTEPSTILGSPVIQVPDMPAKGVDANAILYGDLARAYVVVQRVGITFKRLAERWVENSQIGIYARQRIGGQVVLPEALRIYQLTA